MSGGCELKREKFGFGAASCDENIGRGSRDVGKLLKLSSCCSQGVKALRTV
jgi:hypothetical protein